jgi:hypothetical protein
MKEIFADTFYFVALLSPVDEAYPRARAITATQRSRLVTTAWVLTELANSLSKHGLRAGFLDTLRVLRADPTAVVIEAEQRWFEAGVALYAARPDKDWSLTDCISFLVMQDRGITEALTGDRHFEQAGFQALLQ